jgi:hypothetical protein
MMQYLMVVFLLTSSLVDAIEDSQIDLKAYDAYIAGPPSMMPSTIKTLNSKRIPIERIKVDSFGKAM